MDYLDVALKVSDYAAKHAATQMGHNIVCVVSLKDSAIYARGSYLIGHVAKATMVNHCTFPKYDSKVAAKTGMSITPSQLSGMTWEIYPYIKKANRSGYRYLNIYFAMSDTRAKTTTKWLWDGREATAQEVAEIERCLKPRDNSREVSAVMYQIDPVNGWDGFFYFGEDKASAEDVFQQIGK